jgi:hypothetical protein
MVFTINSAHSSNNSNGLLFIMETGFFRYNEWTQFLYVIYFNVSTQKSMDIKNSNSLWGEKKLLFECSVQTKHIFSASVKNEAGIRLLNLLLLWNDTRYTNATLCHGHFIFLYDCLYISIACYGSLAWDWTAVELNFVYLRSTFRKYKNITRNQVLRPVRFSPSKRR